jgi:3-methylcrotonyl-CoA carboxylase alpha subunit
VVEITASGGGRYRVAIEGAPLEVEAERLPDGRLRLHTPSGVVVAEITPLGERRFVRLGMLDFVLERAPAGGRRARATGAAGLESPMPGVVTRVEAAEGTEVRKGQPLVVLEAMKMEHVIRAPRDGRIKRVAVSAGQMVNGGVPLVEMDDDE